MPDQAARDAMGEAKGRFANEVSENLVSPGYAAVVMAAGSVILPGLGTMAAEVYLDRLAGSNNEKREEQARGILEDMKNKIEAIGQLPWIEAQPVSWPDPGPGRFEPIPRDDTTDGAGSGSGGSAGGLGSGPVPAGGVPSGWTGGSDGWPVVGAPASSDLSSGWSSFPGSSSGSSSGWPSSAGSSSSSPGWSSSPVSSSPGWSGSSLSSGAGSGWAGGSPSGDSSSVGSSSGDRDWGVAPVVVTLPNGSMAGMVPAPVLDPSSSSWRAGYSSVPVSSLLPQGGGASGGWAGAGSPGMGGAGLGASGVGGASGGAGSARFGSPAGGAGVPGVGGARAAGAVGAGGAGSPGASGAPGEAGGAGASGAGSRGGVAGGGMGAGSSGDEKLKRRKYKVFKFRADQDPADWEMPEAAGAGCAEDLKPLYTEEDDEYWEAPRRPRGPRR